MGFSKKQLHELKLAQKRRERRPEPKIELPVQLKVSHREREQITGSHPMVLLGIEKRLAAAGAASPTVDDSHVKQALLLAIRKKEAAEEGPVKEILTSLNALGDDCFEPEDDEPFNLALRVIYDSVIKHSTFAPGERNYINFAKRFAAQAVWRE